MPKMPAMPTCTPTTCPKPMHGKPHAETKHPPRHHSSAGMTIKPAKGRGGSDRGGY